MALLAEGELNLSWIDSERQNNNTVLDPRAVGANKGGPANAVPLYSDPDLTHTSQRFCTPKYAVVTSTHVDGVAEGHKA